MSCRRDRYPMPASMDDNEFFIDAAFAVLGFFHFRDRNVLAPAYLVRIIHTGGEEGGQGASTARRINE